MKWDWLSESLESFCIKNRIVVTTLLLASGSILGLLAVAICVNEIFEWCKSLLGHHLPLWHVWVAGLVAVLANFVGEVLFVTGRAIWIETK